MKFRVFYIAQLYNYRFDQLDVFSFFSHSIRALFGTDNQRNAVHGSDSIESAFREIHFFFPEGKQTQHLKFANSNRM